MKGWTDDQIEDLRDYVALGYALDFISAITERRRDAVQAMIDALGIRPSATIIPEITKPSGAGQATAAALKSPAAAMISAEVAPAGAAAGVQGRSQPTPAPIPAEAPAAGTMSNHRSANRRKGRGAKTLAGANGNGGDAHVEPNQPVHEVNAPGPSMTASAAISGKPARAWRWEEMSREERIAEVSRLRLDGLSNSQIAAALRTNRNTICSFCDRQKDRLPPSANLSRGGQSLVKRVKAARTAATKASRPSPRAPSMVSPMPAMPRQKPQALPPEPVLPPDPAAVIPLFEAGAHRCHYPLWGNALPAPSMLEGLCCGMPASEGQSYCRHHHALTHSTRSLAPVSEADKSTFVFPKRRAA